MLRHGGWGRNAEGDGATGQKVKPHRHARFPLRDKSSKKGRVRKIEMDDDHMKTFYHMQPISCAPTKRAIGHAQEILAIRKQCRNCASEKQTALTKMEEGLHDTYCKFHILITGLKMRLVGFCVSTEISNGDYLYCLNKFSSPLSTKHALTKQKWGKEKKKTCLEGVRRSI